MDPRRCAWRNWKLQDLIDGGSRVSVNDTSQIVLNCNEMIRGSLQGEWVQQASELKCCLVSAGSGGVQVRELTTKADVFNTIRSMGSVGWTENALHALDKWMRVGERWNKRKFGGYGGFAVERVADDHLLGPLEHLKTDGRSRVGAASEPSDAEDIDDLVSMALK